MKKLLMAVFVAIAMFAQTRVQAEDPSYFNITFSDVGNGGSTVGSGWLSGLLVSPGLYEIFAGSFTLTSGEGFSVGTFTLLPNPNPPGQSVSPSGYFLFDNQVSPGTDPFVNNNGLLFTSGSVEINLFSNAGNVPEYQLYQNNGVNVLGDVTLVPVPEPSARMLLLPFGILFWMQRMKRTV
jgi:hypothetical protein